MQSFESNPEFKQLKILVAEDSGLSFTLTKTMIERLSGGCIADWAHNGQEALEMVQAGEYDLVIMDHMMPVMSGIEATSLIRKLVPEWKQPFIAGLSGAATAVDLMAYEQSGMDRFLAKPMRLAQLQDLLNVVAERDRSELVFESHDAFKVTAA